MHLYLTKAIDIMKKRKEVLPKFVDKFSVRYDSHEFAKNPLNKSESFCSPTNFLNVMVFLITTAIFIVILSSGSEEHKKQPGVTRHPKVFVKPQQFSSLLEPTNIWTVQNSNQKIGHSNTNPDELVDPLLVLIVVCSAVDHFTERTTIRDTWGHVEYINTRLFKDVPHRVGVIFLLGLHTEKNNKYIQRKIELESAAHKDILQLNFTYLNLTLKSMLMLNWTLQYSDKIHFLMKTHDDVFLNVYNLLKFLLNPSNTKSKKDILVGYMYKNVIPIKNTFSKRHCPKHVCNKNYYPNYLSGSGYLMSMSTARKLYQTALVTEIFFLEDVFLTGICASKANISRTHNDLFFHDEKRKNICKYVNNILSHEGSDIRNVYISPNFTIHNIIKCSYKIV